MRRIIVDVVTSHAEGAGTTAPVFLGLGGREFRLDAGGNAGFEQGGELSFQLGEDSNVRNAERNDPRLDLPVTLGDVLEHPAYVRILPRSDRDDWKVEGVTARVHVEGERRAVRFSALDRPGTSVWLGLQTGTILRLHRGDLERLGLEEEP